MTVNPTLIRTLTQLAVVAAFGAAGPAFATDGGSGSSGASSASDGAAGSAAASAAAGDAAAAGSDGSDGSAGPSTPTRVACFDRSVVAWRETPECGQYAHEPIPADWATDPRFNEGPSEAVDAGSVPRRP